MKVTVLQVFIMNIVTAAGVISPTATISMNDFINGLPNWLTCMEMLLFMPWFLWAFKVAPYKHKAHHHEQSQEEGKYAGETPDQAGHTKHFFLRPLWEAFFIWDMVIETLSAFRHCCSGERRSRSRPTYPPHKLSDNSVGTNAHLQQAPPAAAPSYAGPTHSPPMSNPNEYQSQGQQFSVQNGPWQSGQPNLSANTGYGPASTHPPHNGNAL